MKRRVVVVGLFTLLLFLGQEQAFAVDFQFGLSRYKPRLSAQAQEYKGASGSITFVPVPENITNGNGMSLAILGEDWGLSYDKIAFNFLTEYNDGGGPIPLDMQVEQQRIAYSWHRERELAGFFAGGGIQNTKESFDYQGESWSAIKSGPFLRYGVDLDFGRLRIRAEHSAGRLGNHFSIIFGLGVNLDF